MPATAISLNNAVSGVSTRKAQSVSFKFYSPSTLFFLVLLVALLFGSRGEAKVVIVDDADTRIQYSAGWNTDIDHLDLDKTKVFDGTLHVNIENTTTLDGFIFNFTGTSVELRYVAYGAAEKLAGTVDYTIDGVRYGIEAQHQSNQNGDTYNQSLFNVTGLANVKHILHVNVVQSKLLFDYLKYEEVDIVALNSIRGPLFSFSWRLAGGVVLVVAVLILIIALCSFLKNRRRRTRQYRVVAPYLADKSFRGVTPIVYSSTGPHTLSEIVNETQGPLPGEPVEAGWMSRRKVPELNVLGWS